MPNHRLNKSVPELFTIQNNLLNCRELSKNLPANSSTRCNANKHYAFIEKDKPKEEDKQQKPDKADKAEDKEPPFQPQPESDFQYQPQPQPESQFQYRPQPQPGSQSQFQFQPQSQKFPPPPIPTPSAPLTQTPIAPRPLPLVPRPLKKMSELTQEQIDKGRMVAAAYKFDHQVDQEISKGSTQQDATDTVLLRDSDDILRQSKLSDYTVIENLSDKQYLVLEKGNNVEVVFRGRAGNNTPVRPPQNSLETILLDDGDVLAGEDSIHVVDTLRGVEKNYDYIDDLMGEIKLARPNAVIGVVSYSNGGPKGLYMSETYGLDHYTIDPVLGPKEVALLTKRGPNSPALDLIRTNRTALASSMGQTVQQILTGDEAHINTINVEPLQPTEAHGNSMQSILEAHDNSHYSMMDPDLNVIPVSRRSKVGIMGRNVVKATAAGMIPLAISSFLTDLLLPDAPEPIKIGSTSIQAALLTKGMSPMLGAGAVGAGGLILPIGGSLVAVNGADVVANKILPEKMEHHARESLRGAFDGVAGGLGFVGTQTAVAAGRSGATAIAAARATALATQSARAAAGTADEVGIEMGATTAAETTAAETAVVETAAATTLEAGTELTGLAAFEAGALTATEATGAAAAAEAGLNPVADGAFMVALTGAAIGGVTGLITSLFTHNTSQNTPLPHTSPIISEDELQRIRNAPSRPHGTIMINHITQDAEFQRLIDEGTIEQVNARVEQLIMQRSFNYVNESGVVNGTDTYPVLNADGTWSQEAWNQQRVNENQDAVQEYKMMQMRPIVAAHDAAVAAKTAAIQENLRYGEIYTKETEQMDSLQHSVNNIFDINPQLGPTLVDDQTIPIGRS